MSSTLVGGCGYFWHIPETGSSHVQTRAWHVTLPCTLPVAGKGAHWEQIHNPLQYTSSSIFRISFSGEPSRILTEGWIGAVFIGHLWMVRVVMSVSLLLSLLPPHGGSSAGTNSLGGINPNPVCKQHSS